MRLHPSIVVIPSVIVLALILDAGCATTGGEEASAPAAGAPAQAALVSEPAKDGPILTPAAKNPRAPEIGFLDISGRETPISSFAGKSVVLVNFWGVRCQNCIEEIPFLDRLYHKYGGKGLVRTVLLGDETGKINLTLWNEQARMPLLCRYNRDRPRNMHQSGAG